MSPDLQRRLYEIYGPDAKREVTPARTQNFIRQQESDVQEINLIREKTGIDNEEVLQVILGVRRGLSDHQVNTFLISVKNIKAEYDGKGDQMLLALTEDCVGKKGKINQKKLRKNSEC